MDAAGYRVAKAQGRKPVNSAANVAAELTIERRPAIQAGLCRVSPAEGYDRWAPIYDCTPNPLLAREERYLLPVLTNLRNKRILDLACGTGRWLDRLLAPGGTLGVGIDSSAAMLRIARKKEAISGRLARANCENLPFPIAFFDLAICSFALGHIPNLGSMVSELARVAKAGADIFISDLHPEAYARGWRVGFRSESAAVQIEVIPRTTEEIVHTFSAAGFKCLTQESLWLGDPEKPIFEATGKSDSFAEACRFRAVLVCHFKRLALSASHHSSLQREAESRP
jgi:ubiquinone/menaquinone biosynthesis C-methylase UbiE